MRYTIIIPDGAADRPHPSFGNRTPLQMANIPGMDRLMQQGQAGRAATVPGDLPPGSDVANLSLLGYDPAIYYTGRAPLEAASLGISLSDDETVFRANTVCLADGLMKDFAGGHPTAEETVPLIKYLDENLGIDGVKLHHGVSYRHLCVIKGLHKGIPDTTPPHDITDQPYAQHIPECEECSVLVKIMNRSEELLANWDGNKKRIANDKAPITRLWLWGGGIMPELPTYQHRFGITGAMISAVDLLRGIGRLAGLEIIQVPGATGYFDTDYAAKGKATLEALQRLDLAIVHVEAPDEAGHQGNGSEKVRALDNIDKHIVQPLLAEAEKSGDLRIMCLPDHPTPLEIKTHSREPVPYVIYGPGIEKRPAKEFSEDAVKELPVVQAPALVDILFNLPG